MTKYKLPEIGDVVKTRNGRNVTVVWIAPESWMYRIHAYYEGKMCLDSWTAGGAYHAGACHAGRQSSSDLMLEPLPASDFTPGQSVKWRGPDGGWKTGEVAIINDGGLRVPLLVDGAELVRDITGELHLVPTSDLQPWPKRED